MVTNATLTGETIKTLSTVPVGSSRSVCPFCHELQNSWHLLSHIALMFPFVLLGIFAYHLCCLHRYRTPYLVALGICIEGLVIIGAPQPKPLLVFCVQCFCNSCCRANVRQWS